MTIADDAREGGPAPVLARTLDAGEPVPGEGRGREPWVAGVVIVGAVVVVGIVALTITAVTGGGQAPVPVAPVVRHVDVVGDSLVHQASAPLRADLVAAGFEASVLGLPAQSLASGGIRARLEEVSQTAGDILVVATTTNDVRDNYPTDGAWPTAPAYREEVTALLDRFSDRCVVVVNARDQTNPLFLPDRAVVLNNELTRVELENDNMVLVDWAGRSRELPTDWFSSDQLHFGGAAEVEAPDSPSAKEYAAAIVEGVRRCAEKPRRPA